MVIASISDHTIYRLARKDLVISGFSALYLLQVCQARPVPSGRVYRVEIMEYIEENYVELSMRIRLMSVVRMKVKGQRVPAVRLIWG